MAADPLGSAVRKCPFLALVGAREGEAYARNLAANPFARASGGPLLLEEDGMSSLAATLRVFHGPGGVVPLRRFDDAADGVPATRRCPFHAAAAQVTPAAAQPDASARAPVDSSSSSGGAPQPVSAHAATKCPFIAVARAPFASMSLSGFGFTVSPASQGFVGFPFQPVFGAACHRTPASLPACSRIQGVPSIAPHGPSNSSSSRKSRAASRAEARAAAARHLPAAAAARHPPAAAAAG